MNVLFMTALWLLPALVWSLEPIPLYSQPPATDRWNGPKREYYSPIYRTEVVTNVSIPQLTPFLPDSATASGTGVIVAPGGGFHALSINSEGNDVARWLNRRGIAAFVLEYRLVPSGQDAVAELMAKDPAQASRDMADIAPIAGSDGLAAMRLVKRRAREFNVDPERIGFMGFSAGGSVTLHVAFEHDSESRPAFVAPIYASNLRYKDAVAASDSPPAFIVAATDDQLGLAPASVALYQKWLNAGISVEMHLYAHGGHGFGMRTQNLPSDQWIERFGDWLENWERRVTK